MSKNPFNISFGEKPSNIIQRQSEMEQIISIFENGEINSKALTITGPRGSGKTVLLSAVKNYFDSLDEWIVVDLNPFMDMHEQLASKLYDKGKLKKLFLKAEFDFSFQGLTFKINGEKPVKNINNLLESILAYLKKKNIRTLVTIDDVSNSENLKAFIYSFQSFLREDYSIYLVMTGLYENVSKLANTDNLTFLLRTPKIKLENLSLRAISLSYENIFGISQPEAVVLAKETKGYAYGYQLLGSIMYQSNTKKITKAVLDEYDLCLEQNVYTKIWESLSNKEKELFYAMLETNKISDIAKKTNMNNSALQVYKRRLNQQGVVDVSKRGLIEFLLPRFKEFVKFQKEMEE